MWREEYAHSSLHILFCSPFWSAWGVVSYFSSWNFAGVMPVICRKMRWKLEVLNPQCSATASIDQSGFAIIRR